MGEELHQVDFPGYDNAQRHGWDGWIEADTATAWIPKGKSGWEFGTDADPRKRANDDLKSRLTVPAAERRDCTFVFVTQRNWPGKTAWEKEKNDLDEWKAVRAFDASDIEQWLEESVPAQLWLAEKLDRPAEGCRTLDDFWERWSGVTQPPLPSALVAPSINQNRDDFKRWLDNPPDRVFIVSADSAEEAVAFLDCLFNDSETAPRVRDVAAYFESADTLRSLATSTAPFLPVVANPEVERELIPLFRRFHAIAVRPRNDVQVEPDIALDLLIHDAFMAALAAMGAVREPVCCGRLRVSAGSIWGVSTRSSRRCPASRSTTTGRTSRLATAMPDSAAAVGVTLSCLALDANPQNKPDRCLEGFLVALDQPVRAAVLDSVLKDADDNTAARILRCAPFRYETWALADAIGPAVAALYWATVSPWWRGHTDDDRLELIDRLLAARRPRMRFHLSAADRACRKPRWPILNSSMSACSTTQSTASPTLSARSLSPRRSSPRLWH
jgi:hypothetical protein